MAKFSATNPGGRPRGVRNKLTARVFSDVLEHWNDPVENSNRSHGQTALELMFKERPNEYVKAVLSIMPKELQIELVMGDLDETQIDELISKIKEQLSGDNSNTDEADAG